MAAVTLLRAKGLSRRFGGLVAVDNVDFDLRQGEIRALIGPNGAGKTTFVSLLCGRVKADSGQVIFLNKDITSLPVHKRISKGIGYTFQITSIFSNLSLYENVSLAVSKKQSSKSLKTAIHKALEMVGLEDVQHDIAGELSYGHQRLLEIAMGIAAQPKLLILDEPTQGLAKSEIDNFISVVKAASANATILLIEHNMDVVMEIADKITVLNFGKILAEGTPSQIRNNTLVQEAYLGNPHA